jgi:hypothetical protein
LPLASSPEGGYKTKQTKHKQTIPDFTIVCCST